VPTAGFYAIESHRITFGKDGEWYSDGERIANQRIADLFARCVRRNPSGGYMLQMGDEKAPLEVEDTPFVIRQIEGDPRSGISVVLNDGSREVLEPGSVRSGADNALYCRVKGGECEARLLRPAYYTLARWIRETDGRFALRIGGRKYPIEPR
jgi:hypothetical protein